MGGEKEEGGETTVAAPLEESAFERPAAAELFALDQAKVIDKLSDLISQEFSNYAEPDEDFSETDAPDGGAEVSLSDCGENKTSATADTLEASVSLDVGKCLQAASTEEESSELSGLFGNMELKADLYAKMTCPGQGEAMKAEWDQALGQDSASAGGDIEVDWKQFCSEQNFEVLRQVRLKGQFFVPVDTISTQRHAPGEGCKYSNSNGVLKLEGTCEYLTIELENSGFGDDAVSGKVFSRIVATDVQETADGWPSSGRLAVEMNEFKATVTFQADGNPTYQITEPAEAVAEGTISDF